MPNNYQNPSYHALGGALIVFVILGYVSCGIFAFIGLYIFFSYIPIVPYLGGYAVLYVFLILLLEAYCAMIIVFGIRLNLKIQRKDERFLRFYQMVCAIQTILMILGFFMTLSRGTFHATRFLMSILSVIYMVCWNYYFISSQRVCVYLGDERYLQLAFFGGKTAWGSFYNMQKRSQGQGAVRYCTKCGKQLQTDMRFCSHCGKPS